MRRAASLLVVIALAACGTDAKPATAPPRTVRVRLVDAQRRPVTDGNPVIWWSEPGMDHGTPVGCEGGVAVLENVPARPVVLVALPSGFVVPSEGWPRVALAPAVNDITLTLDVGATRTLTVVDWKLGSLGTVRLAAPTDLEPSHHGVEEDGTIELEGLRPGVRYNLYVREDETGRCALLRGLSANEPWPLIELGPARAVTGRTVYPEGADWCNVAFMVDKTAMMDAERNEDGTFAFSGVPPGSWTIVAYVTHEGTYYAATAEATAGGPPIVLDLRK